MSTEYYRRGRNWFTAMGVLFCVMAGIVLIQQLLIVGPEFVSDFLFDGNITNEKISMGMMGFGVFMIMMGLRKKGGSKGGMERGKGGSHEQKR